IGVASTGRRDLRQRAVSPHKSGTGPVPAMCEAGYVTLAVRIRHEHVEAVVLEEGRGSAALVVAADVCSRTARLVVIAAEAGDVPGLTHGLRMRSDRVGHVDVVVAAAIKQEPVQAFGVLGRRDGSLRAVVAYDQAVVAHTRCLGRLGPRIVDGGEL